MIRVSPTTRISIGLVLVTMTVLLVADMIGLIPDRSENVLNARRQLCESLAVQWAVLAQEDHLDAVRATMKLVTDRNDDILSTAIRTLDGATLAEAGNHQAHWVGADPEVSTATHVRVPIFKGDTRWATVEIRFAEVGQTGILGLWAGPLVTLMAFVALAGSIGYLVFMRRSPRHLDSSSVVPSRVRSALDSLSEGVLLLDEQEQIILANTVFADKVARPASALLGSKASELNWTVPESPEQGLDLPWVQVLRDGKSRTGVALSISTHADNVRTFMVNSVPIIDGNGKECGVLATFDDVTKLEEKNDQLQQMLSELEKSRDEVRRKNQELQLLATKDPLTGCLNRRSFFERFEAEFSASQRHGHDLSCVMVDIDYFKAINDLYGHATGDRVIQIIADALQRTLRESDSICRYGGEEFCILLPYVDLAQAADAAERFRREVESLSHDKCYPTASFGVSSIELGTDKPKDLLDQADQALYVAKNSGRNRVACWDSDHTSIDRCGSDGSVPTRAGEGEGQSRSVRWTPY